MKPDRFALRCDVDLIAGEPVARMMRHFITVLERVIASTRTLRDLSWAIESDGVKSDGASESFQQVIGAMRGLPSGRTLYVFVEGRCDATQEWFAELEVYPWSTAGLDRYEALIHVVFPGVLLDKAAARPHERLFTDALREFLTVEDGCTQAFISDDIELGELPLEDALRIPRSIARDEAATVLRTFSWVTYINSTMVTRLRNHGAMPDDAGVARWNSPAGGMLIQFTDSLEDFTGERVTAAWSQLLPVLRSSETPRRSPRYACRTVHAFTV